MPADWMLPPIGTREGLELDFKRKVNTLANGSDDHFEMAKDLAALADCRTPVALLDSSTPEREKLRQGAM